ncbi:AAA family ATPase [Sphingomonas sp. 1P06PA]|uniref:chromosome segregation SMC family protein n=1 Tax=Sphingomonas sp. 1P06PA TaxID=554121 RepID=UPI0039A63004
MRIRRLRLSGFKSFVEPAELAIEPGLTGIVGPNGCGKSNLLEAIRWVMGESSPKSLRGGGMEDVIFAGTATRPARDVAEVLIRTDAALGEEIEVVRRIERGAGSAYRINGRDVRQKDVALLFADAATGAHSPALVSQGRIGAIIAARPAQRREMLEEAAGIAGLHVRRKDAEQKLRATETNLVRLDETIAEMSARAGQLRRQARAAERYRALSDAIRLAEARLIWARWRDAAAAADAARAEAAVAEAAVAAAAEAQRAAAAHQGAATRARADARSVAQARREQAASLAQRLGTLQADHVQAVRRIGELDRTRETIAVDRGREDVLAIDAAAAIARLSDEDKALAKGLSALEIERDGQGKALAAAELASRDAELALSQAMAQVAAEQAERRVAEAALAGARQRLARAEADMARIAAEAASLGDVAPIADRRDAAIAARDAALAALDRANDVRREAERVSELAAADRAAAGEALARARATLAALDGEARALVRALDQGGGDRVLARVRPDPGYERALAAALSDDLDAPIGGEGARGWTGAQSGPADPALPAGVSRLADHVRAPAELARRLAQIGVVDADDGRIPLAVGQRLVTRAGSMRRWDGFVARDPGAAAAERLIRANRLAELQAALPAAQAGVDSESARHDAAAAAAAASRAAIEASRRDAANAEAALRQARRDEDQAAVAIEALAARQTAIAERRMRAGSEREEAELAVQAAVDALAGLQDGVAAAQQAERLRADSAAARAILAELRASAAAIAQRTATDRQRSEAARGEARSWRTRAGDAARRIEEMARRAAAIDAEAALLAGRPDRLAEEIAGIENDARDAAAAADAARAAEAAAEAALRTAEATAADAGEALAIAREARAGAAARAESQELRRVEMGRISGERFECPAPVLPTKIGFESAGVGPVTEESRALERATADRERLGPVNLVAETELIELEAQGAASSAERAELGEAVNRLRGSIGSLNREGRSRLLAAFEAVDGHFRRLFATLFAGGEAHLALVDSDDPLEAGLEIMAQPPGKRLSALTLLSGGEQALTAVALIFALFLTNPAPLCVLDEVDAPLDDANIERFCDLLDRMTRETDTRYLIVTHNAVTMSRMHRLFGVTMIERGVSRLVSVDLGGAEGLLAAE